MEYSLRRFWRSEQIQRWAGNKEIVFKALSKAVLSITAERVKISPWGLNGGHSGARGEHYIVKKSGEKLLLSGEETVLLDEGDIVIINTLGGGGYGDPAERNLELVLEDVRDGKISLDSVYRDYLVKIIEGGGELGF